MSVTFSFASVKASDVLIIFISCTEDFNICYFNLSRDQDIDCFSVPVH